jgi:hypothetical protein
MCVTYARSLFLRETRKSRLRDFFVLGSKAVTTGNRAGSGSGMPDNGPFDIGNYRAGDNLGTFDGYIDEVRMYNPYGQNNHAASRS